MQNLNALNGGLGPGRPLRFIDNVSAEVLKNEIASRKVGSTFWHSVAHFKGQHMSIGILDDANDRCALKMDVGNVSDHAT
jgi:hypothetical protein